MRETRVLITEDRDFGELVFARRRSSAGVILLRFRANARHIKPMMVVTAVTKLGPRIRGTFTVIEAGRVRISGRP